jgi:hypothetical protein
MDTPTTSESEYPMEEPDVKAINIRVARPLHERIKALAELEEMSVAMVARRLMQYALPNYEAAVKFSGSPYPMSVASRLAREAAGAEP